MAIKSLDKSSLVTPQTTNSMLAGYSFQDYELIESVFLASNASSVTFANLNQYATEYKHLQIRYIARSNRGVSFFDIIGMRINSDSSSSNYKWHSLVGDTSSAASYNGTLSSGGLLAGDASSNSSIANAFSANVVDVLDAFSTTKNKTIKTLVGSQIATGFDQQVAFYSSLWINTNAITELRLAPNSGSSFVSGSRFSLYGIR
jgi:hypothetical protein